MALTTDLASSDRDHIWVRGYDLTADLMGHKSFAEIVFLLISGKMPEPNHVALLDAILISLMEHGLTLSALASRMTYSAAPEALQGAVAAGLLGGGSQVLGSMEECGRMLVQFDGLVHDGRSPEEAADQVVAELASSGKHVPGIGHRVHVDGDPRAGRLREIAVASGLSTRHYANLEYIAKVAEQRAGKRLPINATGAIAAILLELGVPWELHRGFALISRSAGLVGHVGDELRDPLVPKLRRLIAGGPGS
jgi:citrate synthase